MIAIACIAGLLAQAPVDEERSFLPATKKVSIARAAHPVKDLIEAIRKQTGLSVEAREIADDATVEVEWKERPVLEALDDICRALKSGDITMEGKEETETLVLDGAARTPPASCHWRQFRVVATGATVTITRRLKETRGRTYLTLPLVFQPGTRPRRIGRLRVDEAMDDTGRSLLLVESASEEMKEGENRDVVVFRDDFMDRAGRDDRELDVELAAPAEGAAKIERLRGRFLISFPLRFVKETIPAAQLVKGKEIAVGPLKYTITTFSQEGKTATLAYTHVEPDRDDDESRFSNFPDFDLVDEQGNSVHRGRSGSGGRDGMTYRYDLSKEEPIAGLRYQAHVGRITISVPVDLKDIPLPKKK